MATSRFMKLSGVTGESEITSHKQETEVIAFQWGLVHPSSMQSGGGGSAGRTAFADFTCTCYVDNAYPTIAQKCASGKHFEEVKITAVKMGDEQLDFLTWTFNEVLVTSVSNAGNQDAQDVITYSFQASKMKIEYKPQTGKGTLGGANTATWDVKQNKA
jgi:type VI secretion system secreted protein Hcp